MFRGIALIHTAQTHKEKLCSWCSARGSHFYFIFLIEPPAAPTSRAGPAYQDLKGRQQRPLQNKLTNSQDWPVRVQTPSA